MHEAVPEAVAPPSPSPAPPEALTVRQCVSMAPPSHAPCSHASRAATWLGLGLGLGLGLALGLELG